MNQIFMTLGYVDKKEGTIYADFTGKFPIISIHGMTAMFIMYDWTYNTIQATEHNISVKEWIQTIIQYHRQCGNKSNKGISRK